MLNGKYGVSGAQPAEVFVNALDRVWQEQRPLELIREPESSTEGCEDGFCGVSPKVRD